MDNSEKVKSDSSGIGVNLYNDITYWDAARQADIAVSRYCLSNLRSKILGNFQRSTCFEWNRQHPAWRSWNYPYHPKAGWHCCYPVCSTPLQARIWSIPVDDVCRNDPRIWNKMLDCPIIFSKDQKIFDIFLIYFFRVAFFWFNFEIFSMFLIVFGSFNFEGFSFYVITNG